MDQLITFLQHLNSLSPLAVIGLLGVIILILVRGKRKVDKIESNDLHQVTEILQRIEVMLSREFSYVRTKLNGGGS